MDYIDEKILKILKENSRTSFVEIARTLGLSEGTVRNRIGNMKKNSIIKRFTTEIMVSNEVIALVLISTSPSIPTANIAQEVKKINGVETVFEVTGQYDILVKISGAEIKSLNESIDEIRRVDGVLVTNTLFVLKKW